jgi:hypothetical protein
MNDVPYMETCGLPSPWDDNLVLHSRRKYDEKLGAIERELLDVVDQGDNLIALNILDHVQFSILAWTLTQRFL